MTKLEQLIVNLKKLKRDNFSEAELQEIAGACGAAFEGTFVIADTGKQI